MSKFSIEKSVLGSVATNCYHIYNTETKEAIIVDPSDNADIIIEKCSKLNLKPIAILLTHGHFDHIFATQEVKEHFNIPIYAGENEKQLLLDPKLNCSAKVGRPTDIHPDFFLKDNQIITLAGFTIKVIFTPGHTGGGVCFYFENEKTLICGDTLFKRSYGRYDLPTANAQELKDSITRKLFALPDDTIAYPGHGDETTIGIEKTSNPINFDL